MATYEPRDRIGANTIPGKPNGRDGFAGDENLRVFGSFMQVYINETMGAQWRSVFDDESQPVATLLNDDPYEGVSNQDLPALFVYRQVYQGQSMQLGVDLEVIPSQITLVWMPSIEMLEERKVKTGFVNAIAKAIYSGTERGKHPAFQIEGFEHEEGTFIYQPKIMNLYSIRVSEGKWSKVDLYLGTDDQGNPEKAEFPCLFVNINIEEMYERSITDDPELSDDEFDYSGGIKFTIIHAPNIEDADSRILSALSSFSPLTRRALVLTLAKCVILELFECYLIRIFT
jgi:hypothetical protein